MARRREVIKKNYRPDTKYKSELVGRLINKIMLDGKKSVSERIVYDAFDIISKKLKQDALEVFEKAINNVRPEIEVKSRRIGGATYQIPVEVQKDRQVALALNWIIGFSRSRKGKPMAERLAVEIIDAFNNSGSSVKKKEETHKMAEANMAFAHFRW